MGALLGAWFMMVVVVVGTISLKVDLLFVTVLCVLVRTKKGTAATGVPGTATGFMLRC